MSRLQLLPLPTENESLILQKLLDRDAAFDDRLVQLEAEATEIRESKESLQKYIFYYKAIVTAARRIPLEILAHIFGFLVPSYPGVVLKMGQVCRDWRYATKFPDLWSNIIVIAEDYSTVYKTHLYLERSCEVSLAATYSQSISLMSPWPAWDALMSSAHRLTTLSLTFEDCKVALQRLPTIPPSPLLTELSISIRDRCKNPADDGNFGFGRPQSDGTVLDVFSGSPLLKTLSLSTFVLPSSGPVFRRLTKLHIKDTFSRLESPPQTLIPIQANNVLELLRRCVNLEDFTFDAGETAPWFARTSGWIQHDPATVSLPHLRRLNMNCHYVSMGCILECLSVAGLKDASLQLRPRYEASENKELERVVLRFLTQTKRLRSLRIMSYSGLGILGALVAGPVNLEILHIEYSPTFDLVVRMLTNDGLFEVYDKPTWLAPKLSTLIIDAQPFDLVHEHLHALVKSRFCYNYRDGFPNRIDNLIVNQRDMLCGMPLGEIAEFERKERFGGVTWKMHQSGDVKRA